ncbi:hypothetical protein QBC39DRAFT_375075 [Podospora conica]|nr:hypothetical protein QBC39DRAFT_375075 [Schizothecium conicum]
MKISALSTALVAALYASGAVAQNNRCKCTYSGTSNVDNNANDWCCIRDPENSKLDGGMCWFYGSRQGEFAANFRNCCVKSMGRSWSCY